MKIYWYGKTCFELVNNEKNQEPVFIIIDPIDKTYPKKDTTVLLLSYALEYGKKEKPFTISAQGEYEVKDIHFQAIPAEKGKLIFVIKCDHIKICHLGKLEQGELSENVLKELGRIDILMVNAGEDDKTKMIKQIEPAIIIPMDYDNIDLFLKKLGEKSIEPVDFYKVQKKDFEEVEEAKIVVLNKK
ncbi:MAG: MBL fold metallo-hydrolase [Candidatus Pacebacteria bacterium]|nr:MBL fold metallo-hydrolase [Candidatus Paceibacterota bacterium]